MSNTRSPPFCVTASRIAPPRGATETKCTPREFGNIFGLPSGRELITIKPDRLSGELLGFLMGGGASCRERDLVVRSR